MKRTILICLLIFAASILPVYLPAQGDPGDPRQKIEAVLSIIENRYVDQKESNDLVEDAIAGILKELDPHSSYISADKVEEVNEPLKGNFEGVGIQFNILYDTILVVFPVPGGPSEAIGIQSGDKIIYIEEENVAGMGIKNSGVIKRLRGEKGSKVNVKIKRGDDDELLDFTITRDKIPLFSMDASYMATPEIGYIKLNRFSATTSTEFRRGLSELKSEGMQHLILDLRGNGGGYLRAAYDIANEFLGSGKMIVYTKGDNSKREELVASRIGGFQKGKLVILIDEGSASASEIVSGAIQDWDRGLIVGRRSFGKGLVQREFDLPDGSALRLTVANYYTPTGRSIQKPYADGFSDYEREIMKRLEEGELTGGDQISFPDSLKYTTPNNRTVYGGGGIMPDIFVPLDTSYNSKFYSTTLRKGIINQFVLHYLDEHRNNLSEKYASLDDYISQFDIIPILEKFVEHAEEEGVIAEEEDLEISQKILKVQLKALIARNIYHAGAYFEVVNEINDAFQIAIKVITDDTFKDMRVNIN